MIFTTYNITAFLSYSYDVLVLGGGTAGLTVASRLSEEPSLRIGVLEAGYSQLENPLVAIPGNFGKAVGNPSFDWAYETVPQLELDGARVPVAGGKMLGGSSALNYIAFDPPHGKEIDTWGSFGNEGWSGKDFFKYIRKSHTLHYPTSLQAQNAPRPPFDPRYHDKAGPLDIGFANWAPNVSRTYIPTLMKSGAKWNKEPYSGDNNGICYTTTTVHPELKVREYSDSAYLRPALKRGNINVLTGVIVENVVLEGNRARGARFLDSSGKRHTVNIKAKGEVIVSGGSIQSPKILELSGIGKRDVLEKAGVEVKIENPHVGENFQEHLMVATYYETVPSEITMDRVFTDPEYAAEAMAEYQRNKTGPFSSSINVIAMLSFNDILPAPKVDELIKKYRNNGTLSSIDDPFRLHALPRGRDDNVPQIEVIFTPDISPKFEAVPKKSYVGLICGLMHPVSKGSIHIATTNATQYPTIDGRFYSHELDREALVACLRYVDRVSRADPLASRLVGRRYPAPQPADLSDEQWREHIKYETQTIKHPVGTCSMLPRDMGGVVDARLRVHGVDGLRVVDASVMPVHVSAHTQLVVYAIAEKASVMILEDLRKRGYGGRGK